MQIVGVIIPIFAIAILGYILTWMGAFRTSDVEGLNRYVFNIALPIMLFDSMSKVQLPESIQWSFLLAYYLPAIAIFAVGVLLGQTVFGQSRTEQGIYGMGCSYSNTVLIGLPIISTVWGDEAVLPLMMIITVHGLILFSLTMAVAESGLASSKNRAGAAAVLGVFGKTAVGMLKNPIIGGLAVGIAFNAASIELHGPFETVIAWIRRSALPAALFVTGASLRRYRIVGNIATAMTMVFLKLAVHPLLAWLVATLVFDLSPLWAAVATVTAALPTGVNTSVFANKYDAGVPPVVTATLVSTIVSIVTLTIVLSWLSPHVV